MDIPCMITPDRPKWPLKRARSPTLDLEGEGPLLVSDHRLSLSVEPPLTVNENKLGLASAYNTHLSIVPVFKPGDLSSQYFRIPCILWLHNGNILVACDARYNTSNDFGRTGTAVAISTDGGLSFGFRTIALEMPQVTSYSRTLDPCIIEAPNGVIYLFAVYFQSQDHISTRDPNYDFLYAVSEDGGYTWSSPNSLKSFLQDDEKYFFQCPGSGLVMTNGTLVVPCQIWLTSGEFRSTIIYSNDQGKTWRRAGYYPDANTSEACVAELPVGTIMLIAKREGTPALVYGRVRSVYVSTDLGSSWIAHRTNGTLRMKNPCQGSCFTLTWAPPGPQAAATGPRAVLFCSPLADYQDYTKGRSYITMQYFDDTMTEWRPIGVIEASPTMGYTGIAIDRFHNKILVVCEVFYGQNLGVSLYDASRFWPMITQTHWSDVNLGQPVQVTSACRLTENTPLKCRIKGLEIFLAGLLFPPENGAFPETRTALFTVSLPCGVSNRYGWITCFGSTAFPATTVYPILLEYQCLEARLSVFLMADSAASSGTKVSVMKVLYIPDCRICVMC